MGVESAADLASMLSADEFGVTATMTPAGGGAAVSVAGIFDEGYVQAAQLGDLSPGIAMNEARFHCAAADIDGIDDGATCVVAGVTYTVRVREPETDGALVVLRLERNN